MSLEYSIYGADELLRKNGSLRQLAELLEVSGATVASVAEAHASVSTETATVFVEEPDEYAREHLKSKLGLDIEFRIDFHALSTRSEEAHSALFRFFDSLLARCRGDLYLEFNGETIVAMRRKGRLVFNQQWSEGQEWPGSLSSEGWEIRRLSSDDLLPNG